MDEDENILTGEIIEVPEDEDDGVTDTEDGGAIVRLAVAGITFALVYRILLTVFGLAPKVRRALGARLARMLGFGGVDA